tara:strand:- start:5275 stop:5892 length:618 start_codon:yes stop_codon:yes gene_type:complete
LDYRLFFPATQNNKKYIGDVLSNINLKKGSILEIGSGSGEHSIEFQKRFKEIIWQTSDPNYNHRKSISSWINHEKLNKIMPEPLEIDVTRTPWKIPNKIKYNLQAVISINMIHIAPWKCTICLFKESGRLLNISKFVILYGAFKIKNKHISDSNYLFDQSLKKQNSNWGVRNLEEVNHQATINGFIHKSLIKMPANNFMVIYQKV